jgi:cysteine-rich repeat protein
MTTATRSVLAIALAGFAFASTPLVAPDAGAATPPSIRVQGALTDQSGGVPMPANGSYAMKFSLYPSMIGGAPVASAGPMTVQVAAGLYNAEVPFPASVFDGSSLFLEVAINGEVLAPRIPIVSVPYAYQSGQAITVAPGAVGSAGLAPGAVTADKIGIPCGEGQILIYRGGAWGCGSFLCVPGSSVSCPYGGPPGTLNVGPCRASHHQCNLGGTGFDGPCTGEVLPATEVCDGIDNDCDGTVDDACAVCGNGVVEPLEGCDDGDTDAGDGCGPTCQVETGWTCTGSPSVCSLICSAGQANCDGNPANGCECATTLCCAGACAVAGHQNGLGQLYDSCDQFGTPGNPATYNLNMATAARNAWPPNGNNGTGACGAGNQAVSKTTASSCALWVYTGPFAGFVHLNSLNSTCICPSATDPTWD